MKTAINNTILAPLVDHPYHGPILEVCSSVIRCAAMEREVVRLVDVLGEDHPNVAIARSWFVVLHGSEVFDKELLQVLRETEPVIRSNFPQARRALALNLAAQGCYTWYLYSHEEAIHLLDEAFTMMCDEPLVCAADFLKVVEVLASCLTEVERFDDALDVLVTGNQAFLEAMEQSEWLAAQYDEFREQFLNEHLYDCAEVKWHLADAIAGPRVHNSIRPVEFPSRRCLSAPRERYVPFVAGATDGPP